jgi:NAD(P)-dependent dehydrogenase (short-subunit alcohol dehydrogenase family)
MTQREQQQVAVITGAGRGIGRATAVELARAGYRVVLAGREREALEETARLVGADRARIVPTDVTKSEDVERLIKVALDAFGRIDALVNNAGLAPVIPIPEMTVEQWRAVIDTNLSAAFYTTRAAWPAFERQGGGVVVNISSAAARDPFPGFAAYGAAKAGLNLFGLSAAREGERIGVRVHTIAPSATETGMFRQIMSAEQYPPEKTMEPADVARVVLACVRGDLRYTSGEVIYLHKTL